MRWKNYALSTMSCCTQHVRPLMMCPTVSSRLSQHRTCHHLGQWPTAMSIQRCHLLWECDTMMLRRVLQLQTRISRHYLSNRPCRLRCHSKEQVRIPLLYRHFIPLAILIALRYQLRSGVHRFHLCRTWEAMHRNLMYLAHFRLHRYHFRFPQLNQWSRDQK